MSGERFNKGKLRWSLVPFSSLAYLVEVLMFGAEKYSDHNWKKGLPFNEICESLIRHLTSFMEGEDMDPESGLHHLGHVMANVVFLTWMVQNRPDLDDRIPNYKFKLKTTKENE